MNRNNQAKVLVIEDQLATETDLQEQLCGMGYELTGVAGSEDEVQRSIERDRPDLILLGLHLQEDSNGAEIAEIVQRRFNIPVKLLSAPTEEKVVTIDSGGSERFLALSGAHLLSQTDRMLRGASALKERQKYFWLSSALNSAADGIMIVNAEGRIQFLNPTAEQLTACPKRTALGRHFTDVLILEHYGKRVCDDLVRLANLHEGPLSLGNELVLVSLEGQHRSVEGEVAAAIDYIGAFGSAVFTFRDITQRKWEEQQRRQEQAIRAVERLAETTAHTLNNLLTTILGHSELLLSQPDPSPERRDHIVEIHTAATGVAAVVERLSTISRVRFATHAELNVNSVIESFLPVLSGTLPIAIKIRTELSPAIGNVSANRAQLEQILFNLVANARDAISSRGEIVITTQTTVIDVVDRSASKRTFVTVKVRDTGEGMTPETINHIFEPFFTLRSSSGRVGLGLSVTQGIIRDYNGFIDVKSEPGVGSEFIFGLPGVEADPFAYLDDDAFQPKANAAKTILLVEDDHAVRLLVRNILERSDYQVIESHDAEDALMLAKLHDARVDLLITDVSMPGLSGPDLVRQFAPLHPETKFLLISGFSSSKIGPASSLPANIGFLKKPFRQKDLLAEILRILGTPSGEAAISAPN